MYQFDTNSSEFFELMTRKDTRCCSYVEDGILGRYYEINADSGKLEFYDIPYTLLLYHTIYNMRKALNHSDEFVNIPPANNSKQKDKCYRGRAEEKYRALLQHERTVHKVVL